MKALIIGASGLIGNQVLDQLLQDNYYNEIEIRVRVSLGIQHPKLIEKIIDFSDPHCYSGIDSDHVYCCLGTTIKKAKTQEQFRKVDYEYVLNLAKSSEESKVKAFLVISSIGAKPGTGNFYLRTKGEMEEAVKKINIPSINIFRPSLLLGKRNEFRLMEKFSQFFMAFFGIFLLGGLKRYKSIRDSVVAKAMIKSAKMEKPGINIFESDQIQKLGR
jgi:uncharacterized protein YbjT (DUF2867 family)